MWEGGLSASACGLVSLSLLARVCMDFLKGYTELVMLGVWGEGMGRLLDRSGRVIFVLFRLSLCV